MNQPTAIKNLHGNLCKLNTESKLKIKIKNLNPCLKVNQFYVACLCGHATVVQVANFLQGNLCKLNAEPEPKIKINYLESYLKVKENNTTLQTTPVVTVFFTTELAQVDSLHHIA